MTPLTSAEHINIDYDYVKHFCWSNLAHYELDPENGQIIQSKFNTRPNP